VQAHVYTHLDSDPSKGQQRVLQALQLNPNEPLAWLFRSVLSAMWGHPQDAVNEAARASTLSPADPLSYYFKMILASAYTINQDFPSGVVLAGESLRLNRFHTPTWRVLITAQVLGGDLAAGHKSMDEFLKLDPDFSISNYLAAGNGDSRTKQQFVSAARELGYFS
jgi:adenylate cyclase